MSRHATLLRYLNKTLRINILFINWLYLLTSFLNEKAAKQAANNTALIFFQGFALPGGLLVGKIAFSTSSAAITGSTVLLFGLPF